MAGKRKTHWIAWEKNSLGLKLMEGSGLEIYVSLIRLIGMSSMETNRSPG
jgi:hypothetical protein